MKRKIFLERIDLGEQGCHLFCKGSIHHHSIRILIDTGASKSVLSSRMAEQLPSLRQVHLADNETSGIGPEKLTAEFVQLSRLRVGNVRLNDLIVGVMNLDHVTALYERMGYQPFDFILGGDILDACRAQIDYGKLVMYLRS
ncbi:MAG: clan AA aspartic protease [Flavobacteriales bacterium]|nr:clan AA aspartic protease [Flavobacteriales bacterium]